MLRDGVEEGEAEAAEILDPRDLSPHRSLVVGKVLREDEAFLRRERL